MELYQSVVKVLLDKDAYNTYYSGVDVEWLRTNIPELARVVQVLPHLHKTVENPSVTDLEAVFYAAYPKADHAVYGKLFEDIRRSNASPAAIKEYLAAFTARVKASQLAMAALAVADGQAPPESLIQLVKDYETPAENAEDLKFVSDDLEELYNEAVGQGGLRWRLKSLNRALGPLRKGDFGFIFARPETGKTTFLASEVAFMAEQAEGTCLWINNEEQGGKVGIRLYQASLGATLEQLAGHLARARASYYERTGRRIRIVDDSGISRASVERYCRATQPSLIVIDQLDKIKGFDGEREDLRMGSIYQWARDLAKQYGPVIGVSQSDGSGEGVKYLTMGNVANAKTSKQAEADWILGIGLKYEDHPAVRGLSICKNKLIGGDESVPQMRHGKFDVLILPEIARYRDLHDDEGDTQ